MESKTKAAVNLETELTCSICTELLYQPLTLLDCLHTFCGACLKEWFAFQAHRAESAPVPPAPDAPVFTCPSCRDRVRDTKHDARVATLLEMFLGMNPDRGRTREEREEADGRYRKGERVMPRVRALERSESQRRGDEEERRVLERVQRESLREAMGEAERRDRGENGRARREDRRRAHSATLRAEGRGEGEGRRRRSESRQRVGGGSAAAVAVEAERIRQVEHQSSLRSLISSEGVGARDIEKEIEEFTRQIQEEGLLDGLDLDNINLRDNDELSKRITEAYRRRYRERSRQEGGRRSNASSQSHRSELRPRALTGDGGSRPSSRHGARPTSANNSGDERGRYPPSSSTHLDVDPARRRRTPSGGRSATVPTPAAQPEVRTVTARSQTDLAIRPAAGVIAAEARSSSSPTTVTPTRGRGDSPEHRGASFNTRAGAGLGITQPSQPEAVSDSESRSRRRTVPPRPVDLAVIQTSPSTAPKTGQLSPSFASPSGTSPRRNQLPRYPEPLINCDRCSKPHIEYEVFYNCAICENVDGKEWNICLDCYRKREGCHHWLGFGKTAMQRWEKLKAAGDPKWVNRRPHNLTANRYRRPKQIPGGAEGRRTITTENPEDRLESGTFCCGCSAWTNKDGYWQCDYCNEGEWGFCGDCVGRGLSCTHLLLPMAYRGITSTPPPLPVDGHTPPGSPGSSQPPIPQHAFVPITPVRPCSVCRKRIPGPETRFHCYSCKSDAIVDARTGDYDICRSCYTSVVASGLIATENGPAGWRRCPKAGHRMIVEAFVRDISGNEQRYLVQDLVGGRRLTTNKYEQQKGMEVWSWKDASGKNITQRLVAVDVGTSTEGVDVPKGFNQTAFPPDGGSAPKAVAGWSWYPAHGDDDELMFPKWAEILEVVEVRDQDQGEDQVVEWFHGFYMGVGGLFPAPYVKKERPSSAVKVEVKEVDVGEGKTCRLARLLG
ncbi:hypothetical protein B0T16DRAFT_374818 [Cercophora newfieldiana]|uniref:RING-type domain-containing protein n=1 Tax=Cercophora newfieldiana TaxID=92897 RepID=A0AA39Y6L9_9PEZI|nr:hypothetical protein B0T16DRAFT_374818 [Cercophora newfieldiana]